MAGNREWDNSNSGALFPNKNRRNDNSPHFTGQCEVVDPITGKSTEYWISAWKKKAKNGKAFMSLAFTEKDDGQAQKGKDIKKEDDDFDFDDDIPF